MLFIGLPEMLRCDDRLDELLLLLWLLLLCCGDMPVGDCGPDDDCCGLFFHGWKPFPTAASANGGGDLFDNLLHCAASIASGVPFRPGCSWKGNCRTLIYESCFSFRIHSCSADWEDNKGRDPKQRKEAARTGARRFPRKLIGLRNLTIIFHFIIQYPIYDDRWCRRFSLIFKISSRALPIFYLIFNDFLFRFGSRRFSVNFFLINFRRDREGSWRNSNLFTRKLSWNVD